MTLLLTVMLGEEIYHIWFVYDPTPLTLLHCVMSDLSAVEGLDAEENVIVAQARRLHCPFSSQPSIVYVYTDLNHSRPASEGWSSDVAFIYRGADPVLSWLPTHRLLIAVDGPIRIDKQLTLIMDGTPIVYVLRDPPTP